MFAREHKNVVENSIDSAPYANAENNIRESMRKRFHVAAY
jgi:hypothetical protein